MRRVCLLLLPFLFGCPQKAPPKEDPLVVATVNGEVLSRAEFEQELARELSGLSPGGTRTPVQLEPIKRSVLKTLVERTLLSQAAKSAQVEVSPEEVDRRVLRLSADYPAENFAEALAQGQTVLADLKKKTRASIAIEKLFAQQVYPRVGVTEEELRQFFERHAEEYVQKERVHAAQIVVKELEEARKLLWQLRSGKKFAELARRYSLSADAKVGGDLGWFPRGQMPPEFDEVLFRLSPGQLSEVVATEYGFHIFRVLEKEGARRRELSEVRRQVEERLVTQKRAAAQADYVKALEKKAEIQLNEQTLLSVQGKATAAKPAEEP